MAKKSLNVNGTRVSVTYDDLQMPLLYVLRDKLGCTAPASGAGSDSAELAPSMSMVSLCDLALRRLPPSATSKKW